MLIQEDIEKRAWKRTHRQSSDPWRCETDKSWDTIHRCLTDGKLGWDNGEYPLKLCIFGGEQLYEGDDYVVSLILPHEVKDLARAMKQVTKKWMRTRYDAIDPQDYDYGLHMGEEDWEYTWGFFKALVEFFDKAAKANRAVIFTVSQ